MIKEKTQLSKLDKNAVAEGSSCMSFNLKKATRAVQNLFDRAFKPIGLEGTQYTVLAHIFIAEPITLTKLADLMYVDRTTLGRNLKPLEKKELIEIKPGDDRRSKQIMITDHGRKVLAQALPIWKETHEQIKALLGIKDWGPMLNNLGALTSKLNER